MNRTLKAIIGIMLGLFVILTFQNNLYYFEYKIEDSIYQESNELSKDIVIIGIDDDSLSEYGRWPWSRDKITDIVNIIEKGNPAAIGIDIVFESFSEDKNVDKRMVEEFSKHDNIVISEYAKLPEGVNGQKIVAKDMIKPFDEVAWSVSKGSRENVGQINVIIDKDGVVRRFPLALEHNNEMIDSFTYKLYKIYSEKNNKSVMNIKDIDVDKWGLMYIDFNTGITEKVTADLKTKRVMQNYFTIPFHAVLEKQIFGTDDDIKTYFENKIVLIAPYSTGISDYYYTPLSSGEQVYGIDIQANAIQNLIQNNFKKQVDEYVNVIILLVIAGITTLLFRKIKPLKTTIMTLGLILFYVIVCKLVYDYLGYIVYILYPVLWIITNYILALLLRYIEKMLEVKSITTMFGRYVSPKIVKDLIAQGENSLKLGGIKKYVTLFFVDIRGFTSMSEKLEPETVVGILNEYFEICVESIFKYNGTLDKFVGDEIMAVFNTPVDIENHELAAVKAAIDMRDNGEKLHERIKEEFGVELRFGIGLNAGYAIIGNIGTSFKMDYTCIGDTVNTAARLQGIAGPGQIIISKSIYDKVKDFIETADLGEIKVKGKEEPIKIYEALK